MRNISQIFDQHEEYLTNFAIFVQVRDLQKKMQHVENELDVTLEKLTQIHIYLIYAKSICDI